MRFSPLPSSVGYTNATRGYSFREGQRSNTHERKLRELDRSQNQEERGTFERVAKPVTPERE